MKKVWLVKIHLGVQCLLICGCACLHMQHVCKHSVNTINSSMRRWYVCTTYLLLFFILMYFHCTNNCSLVKKKLFLCSVSFKNFLIINIYSTEPWHSFRYAFANFGEKKIYTFTNFKCVGNICIRAVTARCCSPTIVAGIRCNYISF